MRHSPFYIVGIMCLAEMLTMLGVFTFPSLMPEFIETWQLSNTEAGWIAGILLGGYAISVPVLVSLTDRVDAKLVYLGGAVLTAASLFGFAYLAEGFWSALLLRMVAGIGLAATYMPGLRVLVDRYGGDKQARALAFYTASFSLGTAISFYYSGEVGAFLGWADAHLIAGGCALGSALLVFFAMKPITPQKPEIETKLLDFRPVLRNREAMGYILAYGAHSWELFAMRSWLVAFLAYSLTLQQGGADGFIVPTVVVMLSAFVAMVTSIGGNELAERYGRWRMVVVYLLSAGILALFIGFSAALPYWIVVLLVILYAGLVQLDSAALTAGTIMAAEKGRRGSTLGLHALIGFGGGAIGPLVVGMVLDFSGGGVSTTSWGFAFASMGIVALLGPIALWKLRGRPALQSRA
jgi:MFS family permease